MLSFGQFLGSLLLFAQVNETYNCRYTPGDTTVDIHSDSIFDCEAENPSTVEMLKRYCIL